jgi:tRNA nucleotidyltransferase/poly(A) polymerase
MIEPLSRLRDDRRLQELWHRLKPIPAWLTGGYLRDCLLERPSSDIDLVIDASASASEAVARSLEPVVGARGHLIGRPPRAVWRLETHHTKVDLWPLDGLPLSEDAYRRDFTCNALLWRLPDGPVIDLVGGLGDIAGKRLRAVSPQNLRDDPIRLLRAARFLAEMRGFRLDPETAEWLTILAPALNRAPPERIGQELVALLRAPSPAVGLVIALRLGLLAHITPQGAGRTSPRLVPLVPAASLMGHDRRHPVPAALAVAGDAARIGLLMDAWGIRDGDGAAAFAWPRNLRLQASRAASLLERSLAVATAPAAERREVIFMSGRAFPAVLALASAVAVTAGCASHPWRRWWRQWLRSGASLLCPTPLLDGSQIMELLELPPGPAVGSAARHLVRAQVRGHVRSTSGARRWLQRWSLR